jgi:hypothetical protein
MKEEIRVQDSSGDEIKVGSLCIYGAPDPDEAAKSIVEITEISEPDVYYNPATDADDGGYGVKITFRFDSGETETVDAMINTSESRDSYEVDGKILTVFEEGGDLSVITEANRPLTVKELGEMFNAQDAVAGKPHKHTHTIRNGKPVCVYCGEELEL